MFGHRTQYTSRVVAGGGEALTEAWTQNPSLALAASGLRTAAAHTVWISWNSEGRRHTCSWLGLLRAEPHRSCTAITPMASWLSLLSLAPLLALLARGVCGQRPEAEAEAFPMMMEGEHSTGGAWAGWYDRSYSQQPERFSQPVPLPLLSDPSPSVPHTQAH